MNNGYYLGASLLAGLLMLVEHRVARARGIAAYRFVDTLSSLGSFVGELALTAALYLNVFYGYHLLEAHVGLLEPSPGSWLTWLSAFLALDLCYYLGHRACHRVGVLWALHAVHHQSREYNLAVGLRGPMLSALQIAPFMVPLALAGIPSEVLFPLYAFHTVWKLCVHTRLVGKLGPLEHVLVTPSAHRVHHAHNEGYLDKNFGGVLVVWDRLFGTFARETEAPVFGPAAAAEQHDPIACNVEPWRALRATARARGWWSALFGAPADPPREASTPRAAPRGKLSLALRLGAAAAAALALLALGGTLPLPIGVALALAVLLMIGRLGRRLDAHALPSR